MIKLLGGRCYRHREGTTLPDSHPDAWLTEKPDQVALNSAVAADRGTIGGREVLFFEDRQGRRWAQPIIARGWDEPDIGAPSNRDLDQEAKH